MSVLLTVLYSRYIYIQNTEQQIISTQLVNLKSVKTGLHGLYVAAAAIQRRSVSAEKKISRFIANTTVGKNLEMHARGRG